jgi:hypothetical protein
MTLLGDARIVEWLSLMHLCYIILLTLSIPIHLDNPKVGFGL